MANAMVLPSLDLLSSRQLLLANLTPASEEGGYLLNFADFVVVSLGIFILNAKIWTSKPGRRDSKTRTH